MPEWWTGVPLAGAVGAGFFFIFRYTLRNPYLGAGVLLACLPVLSLSWRLFDPDGLPFPSLETAAVLCFWFAAELRMYKHRETRPFSATWTLILPLLLLAAGLASSITALDVELSLRMLLAGVAAPLLCFSATFRYNRATTDARYVVLGVLALAAQTSIYVIIGYEYRLTLAPSPEAVFDWLYSTSNPVTLFFVPSGTVATIVASVPLAAWYSQHGRYRRRLIASVVISGTLLAAVLSLSQGSWVGVTLALICSLPLLLRGARVSSVVALAAVFCALAFAAGLPQLVESSVSTRIEDQGLFSNAGIRAANYELALQSASHFLALGIGLGHYSQTYALFPSLVASNLEPLWFAHSLFLTLIPEIGLVGTTIVVMMFVIPILTTLPYWHRAWGRETADLAYALSVGVVAYIVIASTAGGHVISHLGSTLQSTYFTSPAFIVVFSLLGLLHAIGRERAEYPLSAARIRQHLPASRDN